MTVNYPKGESIFLTLLVVSLLCAAFPPTRLIGGLDVLFFLYPPLLIGILVLGAIGRLFNYHN